jgi:sec-independent protein translocase protein TatB
LRGFVGSPVVAPDLEIAVFEFSWGHFIVVAIVALIVIGPKELPAVLRAIGQWTTKIRRMAAEFQGQFQEAMREAEMADIKKDFDDSARKFTSQFNDPVNFQETTKWDSNLEEAGKHADVAVPIESASAEAPATSEAAPATDQPATADTTPPAAPLLSPAESDGGVRP